MTYPHDPTLSVEALRAADIPEPWNFGISDRVRFGELDALNHVSNTAYLRWFENFRVYYFRSYGFDDYGAGGPRVVLRQIGVDFLREMTLGESYIVTGRTEALRRTSFTMQYGVWSDGLRATGHAVLVFAEAGKKRPIPKTLRAELITRDGASAG